MAYAPHPHHRDQSFAFKKSQWIISEMDECQCYQMADAKQWTASGACWGLYLVNNVPTNLGVSPLPLAAVVQIAKFVSDQGNWHGYPAMHWTSPYDKPHQTIVASWHKDGYIRRSAMSKIQRGKRCVL